MWYVKKQNLGAIDRSCARMPVEKNSNNERSRKLKLKKRKEKVFTENVRIIFVQFEMDFTHPSVVLGLVYEGHEVARRHHFGPFCRPIFARVHSTDRCPPCDETPASNHSRIPILWERCEQFEYDSNNHS